MADADTLDRPQASSLIAAVAENPVAVLTDAERFSRFYAEMKRETDGHIPDVTTEKGRKAIASLAFKVVKTKTAIDEAGKKLNEDARKQIGVVDAARRTIRDQLDALRDKVRKPLDAWEEAEELRQERVVRLLTDLRQAGVVAPGDTSETVASRLAALTDQELPSEVLQDRLAEARDLHTRVVDTLAQAHNRLLRDEADRAELERLRSAEAEKIVLAILAGEVPAVTLRF